MVEQRRRGSLEEFVKGDVVILPYPFVDVLTSKKRPALVVATFKYNVILCKITTKSDIQEFSIPISSEDFEKGGLNLASIVQTNIMFTLDKSVILYKAGKLRNKTFGEVRKSLLAMFT